MALLILLIFHFLVYVACFSLSPVALPFLPTVLCLLPIATPLAISLPAMPIVLCLLPLFTVPIAFLHIACLLPLPFACPALLSSTLPLYLIPLSLVNLGFITHSLI